MAGIQPAKNRQFALAESNSGAVARRADHRGVVSRPGGLVHARRLVAEDLLVDLARLGAHGAAGGEHVRRPAHQRQELRSREAGTENTNRLPRLAARDGTACRRKGQWLSRTPSEGQTGRGEARRGAALRGEGAGSRCRSSVEPRRPAMPRRPRRSQLRRAANGTDLRMAEREALSVSVAGAGLFGRATGCSCRGKSRRKASIRRNGSQRGPRRDHTGLAAPTRGHCSSASGGPGLARAAAGLSRLSPPTRTAAPAATAGGVESPWKPRRRAGTAPRPLSVRRF